MKCLIVGASAGLGRSLAEALARSGYSLFIVSTDKRDLLPLAADLQARFDITVGAGTADLRDWDARQLRQQVVDFFGVPDRVLFIAGLGNPEDSGPVNEPLLNDLIDVNFRAGVSLINAFLDDMIEGSVKTCVGIGSVAAIRGKRSNMVYGAAKRGLEFYFEAVRHRLSGVGCHVQFYRAGFMQTSMLQKQKPLLPVAQADDVAERIVRNLERDIGMVYIPRWWEAIAFVLRHLPWIIYRRISF